jgi:replicative DNA helicase
MTINDRDAAVFQALCTKAGWREFSALSDIRLYVESMGLGSKGKELDSVLEIIADSPPVNNALLRECVQQFCSRQLSWNAAENIVSNHSKPNFTPNAAFELLELAVKAKTASAADSIMEYRTSGLPDMEQDRPGRCPLGLDPELDRILRGGVAAGEVWLLLGGTKVGKSSVLSRIGLNNLLRGANVLHITLEMAKAMVARRYDSGLTRMSYMEMVQSPGTVEAAREKLPGNLYIVDWQQEKHTPDEIISVVENCPVMPDLILLDYLKNMIPNETKTYARKDQRHLFSELGTDMCAVAKKLQLPVISPWQVNRAGFGKDIIKVEDIAESWDMTNHVDGILGIVRSDKEMESGVMRIHTVLNRICSEPYMEYFNVDLDRNRLVLA